MSKFQLEELKTWLGLILVIAVSASVPTFVWVNQAFASCMAEIDYDVVLVESELVFTGTVTRLDSYDGPQKVTFFIHDVIKGEINTPKYVLENSELISLENGTTISSSVNVDYKIGKTYKVYVENGQTNQCTTKTTAPPADYMWEPGPEDGNYYSENPVYEDPCDEGYGLSDRVCITLEEMNKDLPTCSANPRHDFGKCKKNMEEPPNTFEQVKTHCIDGGEDVFLEWWNDDIYYNSEECVILDRTKPGPGTSGYASPLKQTELGISNDKIQCKEDLVLIQKYDRTPACVKPRTIEKLIDRNWTTSLIVREVALKTISQNLGPECSQHTMHEIQNGLIDDICRGYLTKLSEEHKSEMNSKGYSFDHKQNVWVKAGYPDVMMTIVDYYLQTQLVSEPEPEHFEEIKGYAIDYDGDVKHLPFADVCTDEMKIILLTHSNIALPEEEFVMEDVDLPFGMNQEDFERCAQETSFTKSRWNMITMENSEPFHQKCKSGPAPSDEYYFDEDTCEWKEIESEN